MKKIGILTSTQSFGDNYGAVLQAFALSYKLKQLGFIPYIIRYKLDGEYLKGKAPINIRLKNTLLNKKFSFHAKKTLVFNLIFHRNNQDVFKDFCKNNLNFYNENYLTFKELKEDVPNFDAFITGSDQVWNPIIHNYKNDPGYFLDFVPNNIPKIAYAPSMGVDIFPEECKKDLKYYLNKFDHLSIREFSGAKNIKEICDIDVPVVLDPTLLLTSENWNTICADISFLPKRYILCYKFGKSKLMDKIIKIIAKLYKLSIVAVPASPETKFKMDYRIGPSEFVSAIKNATIICTDSFHASVFSIIYNKPFLTFPRHDEKNEKSMNNRMKDLLKMLELEDRYVLFENQIDINNVLNLSFEKSNKILDKKRKISIEYLNNSTKEI